MRLRTRKHTALLLLLARRDARVIPREQLLDLLWSEDPEASARHSLSQAVSLLNKALGGDLVVSLDREVLALRPGSVRLDVAEFERCAAEGRHSEARALWGGRFLEGWRVARAPRFERWAEEERDSLNRTMRELLRAGVERARAAGDWAAMRADADALLGLDGLDEAAMLATLEGMALDGDRVGALRRYRQFEAQLREEFEAEPGPGLRGWHQRNRRAEQASVAASPRVAEPVVLPATQPVYGRHEEFAALWHAWEETRRGRGSCLLLHGPVGIGKSVLAGKLANQVHVGGGAVCLVRCFRSEKAVPFAPVSALARQLSRLPGFVALSPVWIGELSRLVPELRERFPQSPPPMAIDDSARYRLCDAALHAAECVADEQPLLIVVDDLHDADEATLALLHYLGRQASNQGTLLLGVFRSRADEEFERAFVETAVAAGFGRLLVLGALSDADIGRIVQSVLAQRGLESPAGSVARMAAAAGGNPLQALELALAVPAADGRPAEGWLAELGGPAPGGAGTFAQTAAVRLGQLPAQARLVASALAIAGRPLTDYDLAEVTALPTSELATAIFALEDAQFVRRGGAQLAFAHERYQASAAESIGERECRRLHRALARYLGKSAAGNPAARYEVAHHYAGGGRLEEARTHALAAARYAGSIGAVRERAAALELVRRVAREYDPRLAADLGHCYLDLKEFEKLEGLCREAEGREGLERALAQEFEFLRIAAHVESGSVRLREAQDMLESLLTDVAPEFACIQEARNLLMRTADKTGAFRLVRQMARAIRRHPPEGKRGGASAHALFARAYVIGKYYWPERALPLLQEASRLAQEDSNWELENLCRNGLGTMLKHLGRYRESIEQVYFGLALARKTLNPLAEAASLNNIANAEMARGAFDRAIELMAASKKIEDQFPSWPLRLFRNYNHGILGLITGDLDLAIRECSVAYSEAVAAQLWPIALYASGGLYLCAVRLGDRSSMCRVAGQIRALGHLRSRALPERWTVEAAVGWHTALHENAAPAALDRILTAINELRRRDVDSWLRLRLEHIRLLDALGEPTAAVRETLAKDAHGFGALAVAREALQQNDRLVA